MIHRARAEREDEQIPLLDPIQGEPIRPGGVVKLDVLLPGFRSFVDRLLRGCARGEVGQKMRQAIDHVGGLTGSVDKPCELNRAAFQVGAIRGEVRIEQCEACVMTSGGRGERENVAHLAGLFGEEARGFEGRDAEVEQSALVVGDWLDGGVEFKEHQRVVRQLKVERVGGGGPRD